MKGNPASAGKTSLSDSLAVLRRTLRKGLIAGVALLAPAEMGCTEESFGGMYGGPEITGECEYDNECVVKCGKGWKCTGAEGGAVFYCKNPDKPDQTFDNCVKEDGDVDPVSQGDADTEAEADADSDSPDAEEQ